MDNINDFRKSSIMLVYPNGTIKCMPADMRIIHLKYFIDLYKEDEYFRNIVDKNNIPIPESIFKTDMIVTYEIDKELARIGIIAFHNLFIYAVQKDEKYIEKAPPQFVITLPNILTKEQENIMKELCNNNDMSCNFYAIYNDDRLDDITYDEFNNILNNKSK